MCLKKGLNMNYLFNKLFCLLFFIGISSISLAQSNPTVSRSEENIAKDIYQEVIKKFCRGTPSLDMTLREALANRLRVAPNSITLNRVELSTAELSYVEVNGFKNRTDGTNYYSYCSGIFYAPSGSFKCNLSFNQNNLVNDACDLINKNQSYSKILLNNWISLYVKNATGKAVRASCGTNRYCYDMYGKPAGERDPDTCECPK